MMLLPVEERVARITLPARQVDRLDFTEPQGRIDPLEHHWHQDTTTRGLPCLVAHEIARRAYAFARPSYNHAFGRIQSRLNLASPALSARKTAIPPDRQSGSFERAHQSAYLLLIFALV